MFVAQTRTGQLISLMNIPNSAIIRFKSLAPFYCPACNEEVILKAGPRKAPHFAHKTSCLIKSEGESLQHHQGKVVIFDWLTKQGFTPILERYLPEIQQRPDVIIPDHIPIEFQCSVIPVSQLQKRTESYLDIGMTPVWILHHNLIKEGKNQTLELNDFISFFIQDAFQHRPVIYTLEPERKQFFLYTNLIPVTMKRAYYDKIQISYHSSLSVFRIKPPFPFRFYDHWYLHQENWLFRLTMQPNARKNPFLHFLYHSNIHPLELPLEVGIPVPAMYEFETAPLIWQAYLWHRFLFQKRPGENFDLLMVKDFLNRHPHIRFRQRFRLSLESCYNPVMHYFKILEQLGLIVFEGEKITICRRVKLLENPNIERQNLRKDFFRKNKPIIMRSFR